MGAPDPDFQYFQPLEAWLLLVILGALSAGLRLPVTRIAMLLLLLHEALAHRRVAEILGLATPLLSTCRAGNGSMRTIWRWCMYELKRRQKRDLS